ncbi:aminotransferase class V-fold PLP-dependent enzyme [Acidovorax sp. SUPP2825]|uniref:aminotransferase class V-fold PLP-dependent enzyme n=1 Tax=Acidovorax sp. SUPP2825 TaxID=2920879 RepID=UPI0023DE52A1|nr:aminotransferase class V-fold PLP-dependent enzyme [Acidovorax sp. SUPP2825]GKS95348.1 aminotransferase class V-fold PLP-dependent enzyme [Acidovorax sp. SUPP2825]
MIERRHFFRYATASSLAAAIGTAYATTPATTGTGATSMSAAAGSSALQMELAGLYDVDRTVINLDAAYYGAMTREVQAHYFERSMWVNRYNSTFLRSAVQGIPRDPELNKSRAAVAHLIGATQDEVTLCGGGTEALYSLIVNYRPLSAGDAVIYADTDYDEMQYAMDYLEQSRGAKVVRFNLPEPHTRANVLQAYDSILRNTPRAKLLLLTHVSNRNGLVPPVAEIVAMAKARGVDVILDSAQAVGHMPFDVKTYGADFVGFSLHKWVAAPLGTGAIYIKKERQADIQPWLGNKIYKAEDLRSRIPTGTVDVAARLSIPKALAVQERIGLERKFAHLRALRDYWVSRARDVPGVELMLPQERDNHGAISAFRLAGLRTMEQARKVQERFISKHGVLVVAKSGLASGPVMRVTPSLFNTTEELDRLVAAIQAERNLLA